MSDRKFLVDRIFPTKEVHLIGGASGAGKTTWLVQFMDEWRQGAVQFGHNSHPLPFVYISADRTLPSVLEVFRRVGVDPAPFKIESLETLPNTNDLRTMMNKVIERNPEAEVFFIEGFQSYTPQGKMNDYKTVAGFLTDTVRMCIARDWTIIGACHAAKVKKDEGFDDPRQRINGSVAWAAYSETIVYVEADTPNDPLNTDRTIHILPRNFKDIKIKMEFNSDGKLVPKTKHILAPARFNLWLASKEVGDIFTTGEALEKSTIVSRSTLDVELNRCENEKIIKQKSRGHYEILRKITQ